MEEAGIEALCPFPSIWTWMSAPCGVCSASPPCHPSGPTFPSRQASPVPSEGWEHQTSAHHGQTSPGVEEGSAELQSCWITTAGAGGLQRDTGVLPHALSQGQRRRRYPHPKSRKFCSSSPRSSSTCPLATSPWEE